MGNATDICAAPPADNLEIVVPTGEAFSLPKKGPLEPIVFEEKEGDSPPIENEKI